MINIKYLIFKEINIFYVFIKEDQTTQEHQYIQHEKLHAHGVTLELENSVIF
jgi:hypothetical protein